MRKPRWLLTLLFLTVGCAGTVPVPMVQVPLFDRQGQVEAGLAVGPASRRPEIGGTIRYAATDALRVGASVSGSSRPSVVAADARDQAPKFFSDGFVGAEWGGLLFRFGALAGSGYGVRSWAATPCRARPAGTACMPSTMEGYDTKFVRSYGQLHLGLAPPGPLAVSLALRVPVVVELASAEQRRHTELGTEVALTQTLRFRHLRLDLQPLWSRTRGFAFHVGLLFRFAP